VFSSGCPLLTGWLTGGEGWLTSRNEFPSLCPYWSKAEIAFQKEGRNFQKAAGLREDGEKEVNKFISGHPKFLSEPMLSFSQHPPAANEIV